MRSTTRSGPVIDGPLQSRRVLFIMIGVISTLALFSKPYRKLKEKLLVDGGMSSHTKDELDWLTR